MLKRLRLPKPTDATVAGGSSPTTTEVATVG
jgi:hypothetical protein